MENKRFQPSYFYIQPEDNICQKDQELDFLDYECLKKKVKKDNVFFESKISEEQGLFNFEFDEQGNPLETKNLYQQQFDNLRACSFKTISKIGLEKFNSLNRIENIEAEGDLSSEAKKKKQTIYLLSDQKSKKYKYKAKNTQKSNSKDFSQSSLNQINELKKKCSLEHNYSNAFMERKKNHVSSLSAIPIPSESLNTINTQLINDMVEFNVKQQDQIDQVDLKRMIEGALIKNIKFNANLMIQKDILGMGNKIFPNIRLYKILDVDGFSITGFYADNQKIRINLLTPITNKQFQRKFLFQQQKSKEQDFQNFKNQATQFQGKIYNKNCYEWIQTTFWFSQIRYNIAKDYEYREERQNINRSNIENVREYQMGKSQR